jgi:hypothetical protein
MINDEFKAWLLGYVELTGDLPINSRQIEIIKNHANLVSEVDRILTPENQSIMDNLRVGEKIGTLLRNCNS